MLYDDIDMLDTFRWYGCCIMLFRFVKWWFSPLDLNQKKPLTSVHFFFGHTFRSLRPTEVGGVEGVASQHGERCKECHRSVAGRSAGWKNGMLWSQGEPGNWDDFTNSQFFWPFLKWWETRGFGGPRFSENSSGFWAGSQPPGCVFIEIATSSGTWIQWNSSCGLLGPCSPFSKSP